MSVPHRRSFLLGLLLMATVLLLDQWSKWLVFASLSAGGTHAVEITSFFDLVMVWNPGISFGILAGQKAPLVLIVLSGAIMAILLRWLYKNTQPVVACALGCIMGGAGGNVIDRLRFGAVADFLDFHIGRYHWPAFNIADSAIFIGVVLLCAGSMLGKRS